MGNWLKQRQRHSQTTSARLAISTIPPHPSTRTAPHRCSTLLMPFHPYDSDTAEELPINSGSCRGAPQCFGSRFSIHYHVLASASIHPCQVSQQSDDWHLRVHKDSKSPRALPRVPPRVLPCVAHVLSPSFPRPYNPLLACILGIHHCLEPLSTLCVSFFACAGTWQRELHLVITLIFLAVAHPSPEIHPNGLLNH